jgi:hypothetical protein
MVDQDSWIPEFKGLRVKGMERQKDLKSFSVESIRPRFQDQGIENFSLYVKAHRDAGYAE